MTPILINNRDCLHSLKATLEYFLKVPETLIILADCGSTYPPLLNYYHTECPVRVFYLPGNPGPRGVQSVLKAFLNIATEGPTNQSEVDSLRLVCSEVQSNTFVPDRLQQDVLGCTTEEWMQVSEDNLCFWAEPDLDYNVHDLPIDFLDNLIAAYNHPSIPQKNGIGLSLDIHKLPRTTGNTCYECDGQSAEGKWVHTPRGFHLDSGVCPLCWGGGGVYYDDYRQAILSNEARNLSPNKNQEWRHTVPINSNQANFKGHRTQSNSITTLTYIEADIDCAGVLHPIDWGGSYRGMRCLDYTVRHLPWHYTPKNIPDDYRWYLEHTELHGVYYSPMLKSLLKG